MSPLQNTRRTISIHALRKERDLFNLSLAKFIKISIHALRKERDPVGRRDQSGGDISIHALRKERDFYLLFSLVIPCISIHALRKERDGFKVQRQRIKKFQSTRSARSATGYYEPYSGRFGISIHALRKERDGVYGHNADVYHDFNPRAPQGARR